MYFFCILFIYTGTRMYKHLNFVLMKGDTNNRRKKHRYIFNHLLYFIINKFYHVFLLIVYVLLYVRVLTQKRKIDVSSTYI